MLLSIVGMRFRPPAQAIMSALPGGTRLILRPEPDNAFDPNAIRVLVASNDIAPELGTTSENEAGRERLKALEESLAGFGFELEQIFHEPEWHLGYIKATQAASLSLEADTEAKLAFDAKGWPHAELSP